jgi:hypothetical protein
LTISTTAIALEDALAGMTNEPDEVNSSYLRIPPDAAAAKNAAAPEPSAVKTAPSAAVPDDTPVAATFAPFSDAPVCVCPVVMFSTSSRRLLYWEASAALPAVTVPLFAI